MKNKVLPAVCSFVLTIPLHLVLTATSTAAPNPTAAQVRALIASRVQGIDKLRVPASDFDLPQPRLPNGSIDPRFKITDAKRYLGKLLFHDPVRTNNIRPEFGGVLPTVQTASCGSCHVAAAGSKAGQRINLGVGGEGRMTMDANGNFSFTRTIIPGLVDVLPTPLELKGAGGVVISSGRFDAVDSVPRLSPSMVGFAFNNRLLLGGAAGEPFDASNPAKANKNPDNLPAGENLVQVMFIDHRMQGTQAFALQAIPVYVRLFRDAFPEESAQSQALNDLNLLINDNTILRAVAGFLRTSVTRNSPWDRFLAGDDKALSSHELRGAQLFAATVESGGANCISCHSGPALNKQLGDEAGLLVEENFFNLGLQEHPLQDLARLALHDPNHHDIGRGEVTANPADNFKFKTPTLRQLKNSRQFMHSGELDSLRNVVEYFNAGVPVNSVAAAAGNVTLRFTSPRGRGTTGLGLLEYDVDALVDFLENSLFDKAFEVYDSYSSTRTFDPNAADLTYPAELKALGAQDGLLPSLKAVGNNDELTRSQTLFVRGNVNGDKKVDISDCLYILNSLFLGTPDPQPMVAGDTNNDGRIDIADPIYLLSFLFSGGKAPAIPFPSVGQWVR